MSQKLLFKGVSLWQQDRLTDVRVADGVVVAVGALAPGPEERCIHARGNLLLPGLHEHHIHLFATAAANASINCGPPEVNNPAQLREQIQQAAKHGGGWLRGVGFHESVCEPLDRHWLDQVCPLRPIRIQHRSGKLWLLNSAAMAQLNNLLPLPEGAERDKNGQLTGRFYDLDAWLGQRIPRQWPRLTALSRNLASFGVTQVTDTGVDNDHDVWQALAASIARGELLQRCRVMGKPELSTVALVGHPKLSLGSVKLYLREVDLTDLAEFTQAIEQAHTSGRCVAVHCVTLAELHWALLAFAEAGVVPGDRIEHASVADDFALSKITELGLCVVSQPNFIAERGEQYLQQVEPADLPWLYRGASFLKAGVAFAFGSDAPYGQTDPWAAMAASVSRRAGNGQVLGPGERLTPEQALVGFAGSPEAPGGGMRAIVANTPADLVLMDCPWRQLAQDLNSRHVQLTLCGGEIIYEWRL